MWAIPGNEKADELARPATRINSIGPESRARLKIYTATMTDRFDFNSYLTKIGNRQDAECDLCGENIDSADHFLCQCPAVIYTRYKYLGNYSFNYGSISSLHPRMSDRGV